MNEWIIEELAFVSAGMSFNGRCCQYILMYMFTLFLHEGQRSVLG